MRTILSPHTTDNHTPRPTNPSHTTVNHTSRLLNSKKYKKNYITYADIMAGGTLEFVMAK